MATIQQKAQCHLRYSKCSIYLWGSSWE